MSNYCAIIWLEKFNGNEKNLKSFLIQFEIACQINKLEYNKKPDWFIQCIEGPALQYLEELDPVFTYEILKKCPFAKIQCK